jgi:hypothetical protein
MLNRRYNWKRFWCERGGTFSLSDDGYLTNPDSEYGSMLNPGLASTDSLRETACAILLGEPGIGKSHCIAEMCQNEGAQRDDVSRKPLWFDLRAYSSEDRLITDIFASSAVQSWIAGTGYLHIFLDSLDECLLRIDTLAAILSTELRKLPVGRLKLRIACRTADWPTTLETQLIEDWNKDAVKAYELTPLRKIDVEESLRTSDINPSEFFEQVDRLHAAPLAIKPITLNFLRNIYSRDGSFPSNQIDLYFEGCRILCEEPSRKSRDTKIVGLLSTDQKLAIAMRIAAVTILANRYAIWTDLDIGNVPDEDVTVQELTGHTETSRSGKFPVTQTAIREVLGTGLFSSRGPGRMGWAHQTYAEFLAARYAVEHNLTIDQINGLIMHSGAPDGRLVPQLSQTGAWIGRMVPQIFRQIVKSDPDLFLLSDVAVGSAADRLELAKALLVLAEEEKLPLFSPSVRSHLRKLEAPNLSRELKPYICDASRGRLARHLSIDIAEACQLSELSNDLASVALEKNQLLDIRINAAYAISRSGTDASRRGLLTLAVEKLDDDPQDELKGCALRATWPNFLGANDLFSSLTLPKDTSLFGAYWSFLERELPNQLRLQDLLPALHWIERHVGLRDEFAGLTVSIIQLAWDNLEAPSIADRLAQLILSRLRAHYEVFPHRLSPRDEKVVRLSRELATNTIKRQTLLSAFLTQLRDPKRDPFLLLFRRPPFVFSEDLPWLLGSLRSAVDPITKAVLAEIIQRITDWTDRAQFDAVLIACRTEPILAEALGWLVNPVEINSPAAEKMKAALLEEKEFERRRLEKPLLDPPPAVRVQGHLERIESGDLYAWPPLCVDLTLVATSTYYEEQFSPRLSTLPGWKSSDVNTRSRIVEAARRYIASHTPNECEWIGKDIFHWRDFSGCKALLLLLEESPDTLSNLDPQIWMKWAPVLVAYPTYKASDEQAVSGMLKLAYPYASEKIQATLSQLIDHEIAEKKQIFINKRILDCWDSSIAQTLLEKAKSPGVSVSSLGTLLDVLLSKESQEAMSFAKSLISTQELAESETRQRAVASAVVLLRRADDAGWSVIWPLIRLDSEFGRNVFEDVSFVPDNKNSSFLDRIDGESLGQLYVWLIQHYGGDETGMTGAGFMGPSHTPLMLRQSVLNVLPARGIKGVEVLTSLVRDLPQLKVLNFYLLEAQKIARQQTWIPLEPSHILSLAANAQSSIVQSDGHLSRVIVESIQRLQEKLHAEVPLVQFLWFPSNDKTLKPRSEDELSDYIKIHLDDDLRGHGIVVNREVRIHRGQRTDIHVDAVMGRSDEGPIDMVTVIVEVKGCWNPDLAHAMESQLVGGYLKDNHCQQGIYVVGWFDSELWDDTDWRKAKKPK